MNIKKLNIAETFESIRLEKRLNKKEFAQLAKISAPFYSEIIKGKKNLNITTLEEICTRIEVPIEIFVLMAINENKIDDPERRRLVREIRPHMEELTKVLYSFTQ